MNNAYKSIKILKLLARLIGLATNRHPKSFLGNTFCSDFVDQNITFDLFYYETAFTLSLPVAVEQYPVAQQWM
jgi:hypothetical protein